MMANYGFMLENLCFSYSNVTSFDTCKFGWKLNYIDKEDRSGNFYSDFGSFVHLLLEKYFKDELEYFELATYYEEHYLEHVTSDPPPYPKDIVDKYYNAGLEFFSDFNFNKKDYEVLGIESTIYATIKDVKLVVKPDLLLKHKETGEVILVDYKTADPFRNGKIDKKKLADYKKQLYLYSYFIWTELGLEVKKIRIWFVRVGKTEEFALDPIEASDVVDWFLEGVSRIRQEEKFEANNKNEFFCKMLCSVAHCCPFRP